MNVVLITIIVLAMLGGVAAIILYFVAQKFKVFEDPTIGQIEEVLPGANCGGCGFPGCHGLAEALSKAEDLSSIGCPVGGAPVMAKVAKILGKEVAESAPKVAVVRCNGTCANRPRVLDYDGAKSCAIAATHFAGDTACSFGCLGCGDCVAACQFDAIHMDETTGLPFVDDQKCVACGACVKACPKNIIELRNKGPKDRRIWVSCVNKDKGGVARKACTAACIGCGKCAKECAFDAITVENNVAYIDFNKCKMCRKCVAVCPTHAIHELNFPPRKVETTEAASTQA
jgi:Na+-translocating ferredoxin:NAD+ oxidoreductase subunit B